MNKNKPQNNNGTYMNTPRNSQYGDSTNDSDPSANLDLRDMYRLWHAMNKSESPAQQQSQPQGTINAMNARKPPDSQSDIQDFVRFLLKAKKRKPIRARGLGHKGQCSMLQVIETLPILSWIFKS